MDKSFVDLCKKLLSPNPVFRIGNLIGGVEDIIRILSSKALIGMLLRGQMTSPYSPPVKNALDADNFDSYDEEAASLTTMEQEPFGTFETESRLHNVYTVLLRTKVLS